MFNFLKHFKRSVISEICKKNFSELKQFSESFLTGTNAMYIEELFDKWHKDKNSVPISWNIYFQNAMKDLSPEQAFCLPPESLSNIELNIKSSLNQEITESIKFKQLIKSYQANGHEIADLDPLELGDLSQKIGATRKGQGVQKLNYKFHGFNESDLDKVIKLSPQHLKGVSSDISKQWTLKELIDQLQKVYCGKIGFNFNHITNPEQYKWLLEQIEQTYNFQASKEHKLKIFNRLCENETFSNFLKNKFTTAKRFGIEGCDTMISSLGRLIDISEQYKMEHLILGMPHRGRLNTLAFIFKKSIEEILAEFQEIKPSQQKIISDDEWGNSGDVKYHLGTTYDHIYENGENSIRLSILPNPSHLETVNPVVIGKARAISDFTDDFNNDRVLSILIHGDAAFSGQGVVYETLQMQDLRKYKTGGTIHIIANNQIGFTTNPRQSRTGVHCTDVAKSICMPIFHVNADEPELVDRVMEIAINFRQKFKEGAVIDIVGYRRYGHNELDQPSFTQPLMYQKIQQIKPVFDKYANKLIQEGIISEQDKENQIKLNIQKFEKAFDNSKNHQFNIKNWRVKPWEKIMLPLLHGNIKDTGVPLDILRTIGEKITKIPDGFSPHKMIAKIYEQRRKAIIDGQGLDWATAESLAFATLIYEGYGVRLSGQDVQRGTFSHRHAVLRDQLKSKDYTPISSLLAKEEQGSFRINFCNSHLSEYGILGFEYGYSISNPNILVMWEAQFGDFANGAQIMIDNYISSGESKWGTQSGLTLLLPNGMDGQGPEHSSARIERFLQLADDDYFLIMKGKYNQKKDFYKQRLREQNWILVNCSNSNNYFHVLRRQMRLTYRKPLIVFTPKKLLRFKESFCQLEDLKPGKRFMKTFPEQYSDQLLADNQIRRVILCSGQCYYDLLNKRNEKKINDVAIIRIEQLAPFPYDRVEEQLKRYENSEIVWFQDEHQNYGPWFYMRPRLSSVIQFIRDTFNPLAFKTKEPIFIGRKSSAAPATGSAKIHNIEQSKILEEAFS